MAYRGTEAYDYNRINRQDYYGSAAPARPTAPRRGPGQRPQPTRRPKPAQRPRVVQKSAAQLKAEARRSTAKTIKIMTICAVFFALIAFQIYSQVQVDELDRELNDINSEISVLDSENTRLNMQLDSVISLDKVDEYAQDVLGMVKVENYQVSYIDLSGGDSVVVSGGKVHKSLWDTVKAYLTSK